MGRISTRPGVRGSVKGRTRIRPGVSIICPHPDEDATGRSLHLSLTRDRRQRANPPFPTCENACLGSQYKLGVDQDELSRLLFGRAGRLRLARWILDNVAIGAFFYQ